MCLRNQVLEMRSPVTLRKAVKNDVELEGMREAHLRDAVAIVQFLQWLDDEVIPPENCV
jgi:Xaa-Pro aminopeptidase